MHISQIKLELLKEEIRPVYQHSWAFRHRELLWEISFDQQPRTWWKGHEFCHLYFAVFPVRRSCCWFASYERPNLSRFPKQQIHKAKINFIGWECKKIMLSYNARIKPQICILSDLQKPYIVLIHIYSIRKHICFLFSDTYIFANCINTWLMEF